MRICQQLNKHVSQRALLPDPVWQSLSLSLGCSYNIYIPKKERKNIFVEYINFHIIKREKSVGLVRLEKKKKKIELKIFSGDIYFPGEMDKKKERSSSKNR